MAPTLTFAELGFCQVTGTDVLLTAAPGRPACNAARDTRSSGGPAGCSDWFAERLDDLAEPGRVAGSEELDCGTEDGITVKVSRGEYTDDFLAPG